MLPVMANEIKSRTDQKTTEQIEKQSFVEINLEDLDLSEDELNKLKEIDKEIINSFIKLTDYFKAYGK